MMTVGPQDEGQGLVALREGLPGRGAEGGGGHGHVGDGAGDHGADDAEGQVPARVLGLLGGGGDGVEPVEGEEDQGGRGHDALGRAIRTRMGGESEGQEGAESGGVEGRKGQHDEGQQGGELQDHQGDVGVGALADPDEQDAGHRQGDEDRRQVDEAARVARQQACRQGRGQDDLPGRQEALRVARPAHRNGGADHGVFEDQAPADDPGHQFAHPCVGIGIGAACMGTQACKGTTDSGNNKR